jgi:hypothetical protein
MLPHPRNHFLPPNRLSWQSKRAETLCGRGRRPGTRRRPGCNVRIKECGRVPSRNPFA